VISYMLGGPPGTSIEVLDRTKIRSSRTAEEDAPRPPLVERDHDLGLGGSSGSASRRHQAKFGLVLAEEIKGRLLAPTHEGPTVGLGKTLVDVVHCSDQLVRPFKEPRLGPRRSFKCPGGMAGPAERGKRDGRESAHIAAPRFRSGPPESSRGLTGAGWRCATGRGHRARAPPPTFWHRANAQTPRPPAGDWHHSPRSRRESAAGLGGQRRRRKEAPTKKTIREEIERFIALLMAMGGRMTFVRGKRASRGRLGQR